MEKSQPVEKTGVSLAETFNSRHTANFWKLWSANSFSNLADGLYQITLPLLAVQVTTSPTEVAGLSVMISLPWLVFALQAGSIVDRFDRRKVMLWVTSGRILVLAILSLMVITGSISIAALYVAALLLGTGETLVDTALTSIIPSVVPGDRLSWANARITASQMVTNTFIGPPLAGFLAGLSTALATGSSALLYVFAAFVLIAMRGTHAVTAPQAAQPILNHLTEGLRFLWKNRLIRNLTLFTAAMNVFWSGWGALLVLFAVAPGPMGLGEFEYGLLLTAMAVGGLLGSLLCDRIEKTFGTRNALLLDFLGTAALVGVPAITTHAVAVGASAFLAGFGASVWVILVASIRQRLVPGELLGRVYSGSRFISWGVGPLGAGLAGLFVQLWGFRVMFTIEGVASVFLLALFLAAVKPHFFEKNTDLKAISST